MTSVTGLAMTEVVFILPCLLPNGTLYQLATPSALRATVSPRRRCTTLEGAALRGKDLGLANRMRRTILAPLLGELAR